MPRYTLPHQNLCRVEPNLLKVLQDIYVLSGKVETKNGTSAIEFSGIIKAVAEDVQDLHPGDRVCVFAPNLFRTTERVPA